jgi:hypothetical protein
MLMKLTPGLNGSKLDCFLLVDILKCLLLIAIKIFYSVFHYLEKLTSFCDSFLRPKTTLLLISLVQKHNSLQKWSKVIS